MNDLLESFFNLNSKGAVAAPATVFIYGLNDPTTGKCRYVGKADDPHRRFKRHLRELQDTHKDRWICGLAAQGLKPVLEVLDEVPVSEWEFWEREYIRVFRMIGFRLTNSTDGGDGAVGLTEESRAKISAACMGKTFSEETRAKIGAAHKGKKLSEETRAKIGAAQRGRTHSEESRAKMSVARRGKKLSSERCARMSAVRLGMKFSPEHRAKISAALRRRVVTSETRAKMSTAHRGKTVSEETRVKIGAAHKGQTFSEEARAKISDSVKAAWKAGKFSARRPRRNCG